MNKVECIFIDETIEKATGEPQIKAIVYDQVDHGAEDHIRQTETFPSSAEAKRWIDANWELLGIDECWNALFLTRRVSDDEHVSRIQFRMELLKPDDDDEPFNENNPNIRPNLASFLLNDDGSMQLLTMGMAAGAREFSRDEVPAVWDILFKDGLSFDDLYQLFEFGLNRHEHRNLN